MTDIFFFNFFFFFLVKRAGRHFGFFKRAGRHEKGTGRRALQNKPRQNTVDGGWHVCQAVFPELQSAAACRRVERRDCAHEAVS